MQHLNVLDKLESSNFLSFATPLLKCLCENESSLEWKTVVCHKYFLSACHFCNKQGYQLLKI